LGNRRRRQRVIRRKKQSKRNSLGPLAEPDFDCYEETGLFWKEFKQLFNNVASRMLVPRTGSRYIALTLSPRARLAMVLNYFRDGGSYKRVAAHYGVTKAFVSRELYFLVPKIYCEVWDQIELPRFWPTYRFEHASLGEITFIEVSAAIDCTSHFRSRVHPGQANWYRGDKHGFFYSVQLVTSLNGVIFEAKVLLGHNNDKGALNITGTKQFMEDKNLYWLADGGYSYHRLIRPNDTESDSWNNEQKSLRSIVEVVAGMAKNWRVMDEKFRPRPELQELIIMIVYNLTNMYLKKFPLRTLTLIPPKDMNINS
jgi:hypothetical protein